MVQREDVGPKILNEMREDQIGQTKKLLPSGDSKAMKLCQEVLYRVLGGLQMDVAFKNCMAFTTYQTPPSIPKVLYI